MIILMLLLLTTVSTVSEITSQFETLMAQYGLQGAQIAITRNSKLVYLESFGKADTEEGDLVKENSLFRIASISKPITVMAISNLIADNKLSSEDFAKHTGTPPYEANEQAITVGQLIEHRAGFTDDPSDIMFEDYCS
ncbi:Esterase EstB [Nymphon striatum]|nr:Esterase EstB [Nymphon striatum]